MRREELRIGGIPAILWGEASERVYVHVHGKMSRKEYAAQFAAIADEKGWQTLSFDLPEHGERQHDHAFRCDVWNAMHDLQTIADYAFARYRTVALFACSLGAYFSMNTYADLPFERCLFQSPIVDMQWLVTHMMLWSGVTEDALRQQGEINTPIDLLRWDYYQYIMQHPVDRWERPTHVLYAARDQLQPMECIRRFVQTHQATLTVAEHSDHPFMEAGDEAIVEQWIRNHL